MVIIYPNGDIFLNENNDFLKANKYMPSFFFLDAPLIQECTKKNYILKASNDDKCLIILKLEPYNAILLGDKECLPELLAFIKDNNYELDGVMCPCEIGDELIKLSNDLLKKTYYLNIGMDFMQTTKFSEESSLDVEHAVIDDVDEIYDCSIAFFQECGLSDKLDRDITAKRIDSYRIIRKDNFIVSFARMTEDIDNSARVSMVYTRPKYRGFGYARKVVNVIKNEIIAQGLTATLNVDQKNPISYHLYTSLGFEKVFSQGIYLVK